MKLAEYPDTKPSGYQGLGKLPNHWEVARGRFVMQVNPPAPCLRRLNPEDEVSFVPMEAVGEQGGINLEQTRTLADVSSGYTEFQDGDVIVAKITPCFENGKAALARGLINGAAYGTTELHVLRAGPTLDRGFLFYVAISDRFRKLGESEMYGAGGQKRVPPEFSKDFRMPMPSITEQQRIAAFLDWKTGQIDGLIGKKKELLEKLKEKRLAVITQAVTRGLIPAAPLKDSGIPWLGQVPKHWQQRRLKFSVTVQGGGTPNTNTPEYWDGDIPWVSPKDMKFDFITEAEDNITELGLTESTSALIAPKAVLVVVRSGILRHTIPVALNTVPVAINQDMKALIPHECLLVSEYLMAFIFGNQKALLPLWTKPGCTVESIEMTYMLDTLVPLPPTDEQVEIAKFISEKRTQISKMELAVETAIARLTEYRTALITAATTGKIDVRNVKIPESAA